jgi:transcriptional regulator with XRE-family HTH domain
VTADPDQLLSEFMDAWAVGRRPDVDDYLARAPDDRRAELASLISSYLKVAPTPEYDEQAWVEIAADPRVRRVAALGLPSLLTRLRRRARLSARQLAGAVAPVLGIEGHEDKAAGYLDRLEHGDLDPRGVSERVLDALAGPLRVPARDLLDAARRSPQPRAGAAFFRADPGAQEEAGQHLEVLAELMAAPAPDGRVWDAVDELFLGG